MIQEKLRSKNVKICQFDHKFRPPKRYIYQIQIIYSYRLHKNTVYEHAYGTKCRDKYYTNAIGLVSERLWVQSPLEPITFLKLLSTHQ